ncbi:bifunctional ADP-dependent NAD(P)H-hydrate dehydratase/NAD(P)H-hydrate epimerase [Corynebacterium halotolerans]|uniref:ADP-dependent (S)-NAD(P)H-hydrate dehydratase n=1 Tax=Corynebacterium halotolerans YIM 70093 = DSM 44683 TaxID=1121362 RepID=M1NQR4_9CORY|nr:bifunctional ADP-dependent NAD(P)H-hydrate dehydratase/NAD(P)H-hydrate epimerase [Corynebacterium halotolerans]AGF73718.1 hypothetical protein A605_13610 [Corynebacterium halotolerans YIM 70093 = DSM 44683]
MSYAYPVADIRAAEQVLLDAQSEPDELMRQAAHAVALAAKAMCAAEPDLIQQLQATDDRILLLVGAGGNGGDALYAGAELAAGGRGVDAVLLGRDGRVHERALTAFKEADGEVLEGLPMDVRPYRLIIDGILGLGGAGGLGEKTATWLELVTMFWIPVLAVDVPSGINADTGALPPEVTTDLPNLALGVDPAAGRDERRKRVLRQHIRAEVTVTFGALRPAHAVAADCGEVLLTDIGIDGDELSRRLISASVRQGGDPGTLVSRAVPAASGIEWPEPLRPINPFPNSESMEPGADEDKYSGGVVGICAGSGQYPGAAVLTTMGAVRATSSMVRYIGPQGLEVVRALPEVVISDSIGETGRVQAWVVGPGRGTDDDAVEELAELLARPEPLLIDADGLTLLSESAQLRTQLREREGTTLLTPHAGEFRRLAEPLDLDIPDPDEDRLGAVRALSEDLRCGVLLKGRHTVIARGPGKDLTVVDAGSSWAATPGSGDVLSGIAGAWLARGAAKAQRFDAAHPKIQHTGSFHPALYSTGEAVQVHSAAAWLAAQTPDGPAPTTASRIAEAVPQATARMTNRR